jgi:hypothetical protein
MIFSENRCTLFGIMLYHLGTTEFIVLYADLKRGALLPNISMVPSSRPADSSRRPGSAIGHLGGERSWRATILIPPAPSLSLSFYTRLAAIGTCRSAKPGRQASSAAASRQAAGELPRLAPHKRA